MLSNSYPMLQFNLGDELNMMRDGLRRFVDYMKSTNIEVINSEILLEDLSFPSQQSSWADRIQANLKIPYYAVEIAHKQFVCEGKREGEAKYTFVYRIERQLQRIVSILLLQMS